MIVVLNYKILNMVRWLKAAAWRDFLWETKVLCKFAGTVGKPQNWEFYYWVLDAKEDLIDFSGVVVTKSCCMKRFFWLHSFAAQ